MLTPFKCLKFGKSFAALYISHPLLIYAQTSSQITLFHKKSHRIRLGDMELTADGSYSM